MAAVPAISVNTPNVVTTAIVVVALPLPLRKFSVEVGYGTGVRVTVQELKGVAQAPFVGSPTAGIEAAPGVPVIVSVREGGENVCVGAAVTGVKEETKELLAVL